MFMFILKPILPFGYAFSGGSLAILKGMIFFVIYRDFFGFLDIVTGFCIILNLFFSLPLFVLFLCYLYLVYKIVGTIAIFV